MSPLNEVRPTVADIRTPAVQRGRLFLRSVACFVLGITISFVLGFGGAIDAEFARSPQPPSLLCALWRGFTPESWLATRAYDPVSALSYSSNPSLTAAQLDGHRSSLLWSNRLALLDIGRGLFDSIRIYERAPAAEPSLEWPTALDEVMRSRVGLASFLAKSDETLGVSRCESPGWLDVVFSDTRGQLARGVMNADGGFFRMWLSRPRWRIDESPQFELKIHTALPAGTGRSPIVPASDNGARVGDLYAPQNPRSLSELLSAERRHPGLAEARLWECRAYGWPLRYLVVHGERVVALETIRSESGSTEQLTEQLTELVFSDGLPIVTATAPSQPPFYDSPAIGLPTRVSWILLFLNSVVWGGTLMTLWSAPAAASHSARWTIAKLRSRKGNCRRCGYSRTGLATDAACPECGEAAVVAA